MTLTLQINERFFLLLENEIDYRLTLNLLFIFAIHFSSKSDWLSWEIVLFDCAFVLMALFLTVFFVLYLHILWITIIQCFNRVKSHYQWRNWICESIRTYDAKRQKNYHGICLKLCDDIRACCTHVFPVKKWDWLLIWLKCCCFFSREGDKQAATSHSHISRHFFFAPFSSK